MDRVIAAKQPADVQSYVGAFVRRVYNWMGGGLLLTAAVAFLTWKTPALQRAIIGNPILFFGLIIGELVLVFVMVGAISRMRASTAMGLFILYSILNGLTLSVVFIRYDIGNIFGAFIATSVMFGAMSVYGYTTKRDLTNLGSFLMMGLIGLIVAMIVNMFLRSPMMSYIISFIGVLIFVGLTAYDTQKIKTMALEGFGDAEAESKGAVMGALALYLDFINLFLLLLHLFAGSRD